MCVDSVFYYDGTNSHFQSLTDHALVGIGQPGGGGGCGTICQQCIR